MMHALNNMVLEYINLFAFRYVLKFSFITEIPFDYAIYTTLNMKNVAQQADADNGVPSFSCDATHWPSFHSKTKHKHKNRGWLLNVLP